MDHGIVAQRSEDERMVKFPESLQRGNIHVVVMIVGNENAVDLGEIFNGNRRWILTPWTDPSKGADSIGPDRVKQNISSGDLDQQR